MLKPIEDYLYLVDYVVDYMTSVKRFSNVSKEELSSGVALCLLMAYSRYDPTKNTAPETYFIGTMKRGIVREYAALSSFSDKDKKLYSALMDTAQGEGVPMEQCSLLLEEYKKYSKTFNKAKKRNELNINNLPDETRIDSSDIVCDKDMVMRIIDDTDLDEREREVLYKRAVLELTFAEIGAKWGMTPQGVMRIYKNTISKLHTTYRLKYE
jgi:DNA-directed RNA polymerase specialized sigma subunit